MIWRFWSSALVNHLEGEITWLRLELQKSRQETATAQAELCKIKTDGQANLHPRPLIPEREADLTKELSTLQSDPEWAQAGN